MSKICIDGFNISLPHGTGIATYGHTLLQALAETGAQTQVLFGPYNALTPDNSVNEAILFDRTKPVKGKKTLRSKWDLARTTRQSARGRTVTPVRREGSVIWPYELKANPLWAAKDLYSLATRCYSLHGHTTPVLFDTDGPVPDVMHWTVPLPLYAKGRPNIVTIHDMIPLRLPYTTSNDRDAFMRLHKNSAERADHIAVVSEATRQDVIDLLKVPAEKVSVTYQSVSVPAFSAVEDEDMATALSSTFNLGWKDYFLHFGAIEPKKNLGRLVEAYLASGSKTPLVIVGGRGWMRDDEVALLEQFQHDPNVDGERIRLYEYMSRDILLTLVRGARATLFPSLYEGFGLPALEAMALGTATLSSDRGALPEVVGDAALKVDPTDIQAMSQAIRTLDADHDLRRSLEAQGITRAAMFSMQNYQNRLRDLYAKVGVAI